MLARRETIHLIKNIESSGRLVVTLTRIKISFKTPLDHYNRDHHLEYNILRLPNVEKSIKWNKLTNG